MDLRIIWELMMEIINKLVGHLDEQQELIDSLFLQTGTLLVCVVILIVMVIN